MSKNNNKVGAIMEIEDEESMILEEEIDEDYEPTQEEIHEYAQFLGMDMQEDKDLFYIAREGLKAPLPEVWKPAKNRNGDIYYINLKTKQTQWEHPCDEHYKKVYQEAKKKKKEPNKNQKQPISKIKTNFAFDNKSPTSKSNALPLIQDMSATLKTENDNGRRETNMSFESREYSPKNRQGSPVSNNTPKALINKKPAEKISSPKPQKSNPNINIFQAESPTSEEFTKIDEEYEDKLFSHKLEKEKNLKRLKEENKEAEESHDDYLKQKMTKDLDNLRTRLIENVRNVSQAFVEDKEEIKHNLTLEYHQKFDIEANKLDQENIRQKLKMNSDQDQELEKTLKKEEDKFAQENEMKISELTKTKKNMTADQKRNEETKKQKEKSFDKAIENEKTKIEDEFKGKLNDFTSKEVQIQQRELDSYRNEFKIKINEEKSALLVAQKRRASLTLAKENDLKEIYDKKFELEKAKLENEFSANLKNFEDSEKVKKDEILDDIKSAELSLEKDKRKMIMQKEIDKLKDNYQRRLTVFEVQLKDHLNNEKKMIDQEMINMEERYQLEVENIRMDITTKDDILNQINRSQKEDENLTNQIEEVESLKNKQHKENIQLKERIERLKSQTKSQNQIQSKLLLKDLENKVKEAESILKNLRKPSLKDNNEPFSNPTSIKTSQTSNNIKGSFPLIKIIEDIDEIKTILVKDEQELTHSSQGSKTNFFKMLSPKSSMRLPEKSVYNPSIKLENKSFIEERWNHLYAEEQDKISDIREKLQECKKMMNKKQQNLAQAQEKFKKDLQDFKFSAQKTSHQKKVTLKQIKRTLDRQIHKFSEIMQNLKQADILLETKENLCLDLGKAIYRMERGHMNLEKVEAIYQKCKRIEVQIPFIEDERQANFYETWENIIENQSGLDLEILDNGNNFESQMRKNFTEQGFFNHEQRDEFYMEKRLENQSMLGSTGNLRFSYTNLFQTLDTQKQPRDFSTESLFFQRRMDEALEDRKQVKTFLSSHSEWLKDIKQKLTFQLYEKPSAISSRDQNYNKKPLF